MSVTISPPDKQNETLFYTQKRCAMNCTAFLVAGTGLEPVTFGL